MTIEEHTPLLGASVASGIDVTGDESSTGTNVVAASVGGREQRTLMIALCLTSFFFVVELIGGYIAGSLAIMSDAAHLLSDLAGLLISLVAVSVARIPASAMMSFGYVRAEVLGALVSLLVIWALTAVLVLYAIRRLFSPHDINGPLMLAIGIIGLGVNIVLGLVLGHGHGHGHKHDHSHSVHEHEHGEGHAHADVENPEDQDHAHSNVETQRDGNIFQKWRSMLVGDDIQSVNVRAAYLHVLGDLLQSIGVVLAALIITLFPSVTWMDPLCTLFFAVLVFMTTRGLARETIVVLMEGSPSHISLEEVHSSLLGIEGVLRVGDLHVWSITTRRPALSAHLFKELRVDEHVVLKRAQCVLKEQFGISHVTIQINCVESDCCDEGDVNADDKRCVSTKNLGGS